MEIDIQTHRQTLSGSQGILWMKGRKDWRSNRGQGHHKVRTKIWMLLYPTLQYKIHFEECGDIFHSQCLFSFLNHSWWHGRQLKTNFPHLLARCWILASVWDLRAWVVLTGDSPPSSLGRRALVLVGKWAGCSELDITGLGFERKAVLRPAGGHELSTMGWWYWLWGYCVFIAIQGKKIACHCLCHCHFRFNIKIYPTSQQTHSYNRG